MARTGGRQLGTPNKVTATFKNAVRIVYEDIGGHAAFAAWARENPTEFYRIASRLIPSEITAREGTILNVIIRKDFKTAEEMVNVPRALSAPVIEH